MINCEVLVIGSGPGGAMTACLLAEAGKDVLLVEEGPDLPLSSSKSYSSEEMDQKYRNRGLTVAFGKDKIAFAEARCVGGGSEVNAALFHPPLAQTIDSWAKKYQILELAANDFQKHQKAIEQDLGVSLNPGSLSQPSVKLQLGADRLGWKHSETARCFKYERKSDEWIGKRQSMSETYIPRAKKAGCQFMPNTKVIKIHHSNGKASKVTALQQDGKFEISFDELFVCSGAVQTPFLLRKSGITRNIGNSLRMHPMVRLAAVFPDDINDDDGVPVVQIEQFKPHLTLGCSCSTPGHLALWLEGSLQQREKKIQNWKKMGIFYAALTPEGMGKVRPFPYIPDPFVSYKLTAQDMRRLGEGLYHLAEVLFSAGAQELIFPMSGYESVSDLESLKEIRAGLRHNSAPITAIHLFSSCPMGEDKSVCAVDSFGKLHNFENIHINDGSILPECPGVNPQATIMTLARRNITHKLASTTLK